MSVQSSPVHVTPEAIKRLLRDVKTIMTSPLTDQGIYYHHDSSDILRGLAMIVGPKDTVYEGGYYLFEIVYPPNYPHSPPEFKFYTNDGTARLHPNLYKSGKVCLSILNTWRGEGWTSCQTISSVLITVCSILCPKPLLNEPGVASTHRDMGPYEAIVSFKNYDLAIAGMLETGSSHFPLKFECFKPEMERLFVKNYDMIAATVAKRREEYPRPTTLYTEIYRMSLTVDFSAAARRLTCLAERFGVGSCGSGMRKISNKKIKTDCCVSEKIE